MLVGVGLSIFVLWDVLRRPEWLWQSSGTSKPLWITLGVLGIFPGACCCGLIGLIGGIIYVTSVRQQLDAIERSAGYGGCPPGPGVGYGQPPGPPGWGAAARSTGRWPAAGATWPWRAVSVVTPAPGRAAGAGLASAARLS